MSQTCLFELRILFSTLAADDEQGSSKVVQIFGLSLIHQETEPNGEWMLKLNLITGLEAFNLHNLEMKM